MLIKEQWDIEPFYESLHLVLFGLRPCPFVSDITWKNHLSFNIFNYRPRNIANTRLTYVSTKRRVLCFYIVLENLEFLPSVMDIFIFVTSAIKHGHCTTTQFPINNMVSRELTSIEFLLSLSHLFYISHNSIRGKNTCDDGYNLKGTYIVFH